MKLTYICAVASSAGELSDGQPETSSGPEISQKNLQAVLASHSLQELQDQERRPLNELRVEAVDHPAEFLLFQMGRKNVDRGNCILLILLFIKMALAHRCVP